MGGRDHDGDSAPGMGATPARATRLNLASERSCRYVASRHMDVVFQGIDIAELERVLAAGVDHGGHPVQPFVDTEGGWPLRCCLADSAPGDEVAIIAWTQSDVLGPYRETGPIVVHTNGCTGAPPLPELPAGLDGRPMMLRP